MSSVTTLANSLPSSVPKLDSSSLNWAIFLLCFQDAMEAKGYWGYFDGSAPCPITTSVTASDGTKTTNNSPVEQWNKDERLAKSLLTQKIPDSALMKIWNKKTVKDHWDTIVQEYTKKGSFAQTELRMHFLETRCQDKGDICQFLDDLCVKREELAIMGVEIDEKDYRSTIISSLPIHLSNFASNQLAVARMYAPLKTINPDALILLIAEEYNHQRVQHA